MTLQKNTSQEIFLKEIKDKKKYVNVYLNNGIKITGRICDFDKFTINIPDLDGDDQLIYKNSISTIRILKERRNNQNFGNSDSYNSMSSVGFMKKKKDY